MEVVESQTDEDLLPRAGQGQFAAFQTVVERYQRRVYGLAWRITRHAADAEDVTQQTFLSLIEHLDSFRGTSAAGWILRIATNHALKVLRRRRNQPHLSWSETDANDSYSTLPHPDFIADWQAPPEVLVQRQETRAAIEAALEELDDKYRLVFILRDIEELSVRETAEALDISEANVKVRLLRARLMLRERLVREFGDEATRVFPDHRHD